MSYSVCAWVYLCIFMIVNDTSTNKGLFYFDMTGEG